MRISLSLLSGAPAMTSRGLKEADFVQIGEYLHRGLEICLAVQEKSGKKLVDFNAALGEEANRTLGLRPSLSPAQA